MIQKLLDDHELEFDGYTDKCCISKSELSELMKEYAILMCEKQGDICDETSKNKMSEIGIYSKSPFCLNSPLPEELQ